MTIFQVMGNPFPLKENSGKSFQGSIVLGKGFILSPEEAKALIAKDERNRDVLFPYLNGEDLNNSPTQEPSRWVINFFDWDEERAKTYPDCFEIVERLVKPERTKYDESKNSWNKSVKEHWWQFGSFRVNLYNAISKLDQVMALNRHSKHFSVTFIRTGIVFSEATIVIAIDSFAIYAILSSTFHDIWAWKNSSTMGSATLRYSASGAFETFPFPQGNIEELQVLGKTLYQKRVELTSKYRIGLTELLNSYHQKDYSLIKCSLEEIHRLQELVEMIDRTIIKSYEWDDIHMTYSYFEIDHLPENDRVRFTVAPSVRQKILTRLFFLNNQCHEQENNSK